MSDANEILRQNLRREREARGLSHRAFAELTGKVHPYTFRFERGDHAGITVAVLDDFARALDMQPWQLLIPERRLQENGR